MHMELPQEKLAGIRQLIDPLGNGQARRMAGPGVVTEENGAVRRRGRLKARRHFSRVQRGNTRAAIPGHEEHGGVLCAGRHIPIRRVSRRILDTLHLLCSSAPRR